MKNEMVKVPRELLDKISSLWAVGLDMGNEIKTIRAILAQPVADEQEALGEREAFEQCFIYTDERFEIWLSAKNHARCAQAAPQPCVCRTPEAAETRQKDEAEAVKLQRILFDRHAPSRPVDTGLMGWAAAILSAQEGE